MNRATEKQHLGRDHTLPERIAAVLATIGMIWMTIEACRFVYMQIVLDPAFDTDSSAATEVNPSSISDVNVADYFVITSRPYYEQHAGNLGEMATSLHFYDLDQLVATKYGQQESITCLPIECGNGDMVFDYSFYTPAWKVELCTQVEQEADAIASYIVLEDRQTGECLYESLSKKVEYRIGNYLTNMHAGTYSGESRLFQIERQTFVDFLAMVGSGALEQTAKNPFEVANVPYQRCDTENLAD